MEVQEEGIFKLSETGSKLRWIGYLDQDKTSPNRALDNELSQGEFRELLHALRDIILHLHTIYQKNEIAPNIKFKT